MAETRHPICGGPDRLSAVIALVSVDGSLDFSVLDYDGSGTESIRIFVTGMHTDDDEKAEWTITGKTKQGESCTVTYNFRKRHEGWITVTTEESD